MPSIIFSIRLKRGWPTFSRITISTTSRGMQISSRGARPGETMKLMTVARITITGARYRVTRDWRMVSRRVLMSVVARVISWGVEMWSMLAKEKLSIFPSRVPRMFRAKPWVAMAEHRAASTPMAMDRQATPTIMAPTVSTKRLRLAISSGENSPWSMKVLSRYRPPSTMVDMSMGISSSSTTSVMPNIRAAAVQPL